MAYRFICVMCFIPKYSFKFNFSKTDAHNCFTEYDMNISCEVYNMRRHVKFTTKTYYTPIPKTFQQSIFLQWAHVKTS